MVGAGPAGLACAHVLARQGHEVAVFDARPKPGGLNEYGLASYKTPDNFAQREVQWLLDLGGITVHSNWKLETTTQLDALRKDYDAVFLGLGLSATHALGVPGENLAGVRDAVVEPEKRMAYLKVNLEGWDERQLRGVLGDLS